MKPKDCRGVYCPWVCGFCTQRRECNVMGGKRTDKWGVQPSRWKGARR